MISYTCRPEILPVIEAALAANGYRIAVMLSPQWRAASLVVMTNGSGTALLFHTEASDLAEIEIRGGAHAAYKALADLPLEPKPPMPLERAVAAER